jgi:hypothetical protein
MRLDGVNNVEVEIGHEASVALRSVPNITGSRGPEFHSKNAPERDPPDLLCLASVGYRAMAGLEGSQGRG